MLTQATNHVFYANAATSIILELIHRFSREQQLHSHMSKICEAAVKELEESEKWKKQNQSLIQGIHDSSIKKPGGRNNRSVVDSSQNNIDQTQLALAKKMKERLLVNFLKQIILFGVELIKEDIRTQLLKTYARLENTTAGVKVKQPKSLHYLLQLYRTEE